MRSLALAAAALILFGGGSAFAQVGSPSNSQSNAPGTRTTSGPAPRSPSPPLRSPMAVPGTIRTGAAAFGNVLGAIPPMVGTPATIANRDTVGRITTCPATESAAAQTTPFNATFADPLSGALPAQPLPGATLPPAYSFGSSISTGACDPTENATATIEALGASVSVTLPGLATITGSTYSDATIPSTSTQAGGSGLSPLIVVPTPVNPSASPNPQPTSASPNPAPTVDSIFSSAAMPSQ